MMASRGRQRPLLQLALEIGDEALQDGADRGREDGRGRPVVLTPDGHDLVRERDRQPGEARAERRAERRLVRRIAVAEQEVDRDGAARARAVRAVAARADHGRHLVEDAGNLGFLQRGDHVAVVVDPLAHAEAVAPRHARLRPPPAQIVSMGARDAADQRNVLEARRGEVDHARAGALQARVGRDGGAEDEVAHGLRRDAGAIEGIEHPDLGRRGGARPLGDDDPAILVDRDEIGVGAARIDSDSQHSASLLQSVPMALRSVAQAAAFASATEKAAPPSSDKTGDRRALVSEHSLAALEIPM